MDYRKRIFDVFGPNIFSRPLFYQYPGGLRFELSPAGEPSFVKQFLAAHHQAMAICEDIFTDGSMTVCLRLTFDRFDLSKIRTALYALRLADVNIARHRSIWFDDVLEWDAFRTVSLVFECETKALAGLLWCAVGIDLGISPCPKCDSIYLFNLKEKIAVLPYDDRGMDVVGQNHARLAAMYLKYQNCLLAYDLPVMNETFARL